MKLKSLFYTAVVLTGLSGFGCEHSLKPIAVEPGQITNKTFAPPSECSGCHPNHFSEWQVSMHAYAFTDPIFFRLNEIGHQRSNGELGQFCTKCHSPAALLEGEQPPFNFAELSQASKNAIQCDVCHKVTTFERGQGTEQFRDDNVRQGPILNPVPNSYHESKYDARYAFSGICASCHDVFTPEGVQVEFTSIEWDESPYLGMGLECQGCHMPAYRGQAAVGGPERTVHRHKFIGVDIPLVDFPGKQQTIADVDELLKNSVSIQVLSLGELPAARPFPIDVRINNDRTGHNVPTGTAFERQMWIEVVLRNASTNEIVFASGTLDSNGDLRNHHSEEVSNGTVDLDSSLALYHNIAKKNGEEILFFWEADEIENRTIPPFENRTARYKIPPLNAGNYSLSVRLKFRSFAPYFLRAIDLPELIQEVPIFEMAVYQETITVN